jgi:hypothetical protein
MIGLLWVVLAQAPGPIENPVEAPRSEAPGLPKPVTPKEITPKEITPKALAPRAFVPREIVPRTLTEQRADAILLDSVVHEDAWWVQSGLMASIYDPRRDLVAARWSVGTSIGRRFTRWGFFGLAEFDQTLDFSLDTQFLSVLNLGVGAEYLNFLGHVRSSLTVGTSILLSDTAIDDAGESGWFIDLRPAGLRWAMSDHFTLEFVPISLDIITPVPSGIPLIVFSYGTLLSIEWSSQ